MCPQVASKRGLVITQLTGIVLDFLVDCLDVRFQVAFSRGSKSALVANEVPYFPVHSAYVAPHVTLLSSCVVTFITLMGLNLLIYCFNVMV